MATIAGLATGNPNLSILLTAVGYLDEELDAGLVATLSDPDADLTVFAPTNAAFGLLAQDFGFDGDPADATAVTTFLVGNIPAETLLDVVLYHVLPSSQSSTDIANAETLTTFNNLTITPDLPTLVDNEPDAPDPSLIDIDIPADNGIVHTIDRVLLPENRAEITTTSITGIVLTSGTGFDTNGDDFDLLREAVVTADLATTLDDAHADFTVFAPTDSAFVGLAQGLGYGSDDEEGAWGYLVEALTLLGGGDPIAPLTQILTYHVAGESLQASQVIAAGSVETLQGGEVTVDLPELVDLGPVRDYPDLVATDVQATNGIVHVIDGVLLPGNPLPSDGSDDVDFIVSSDRGSAIFTGNDNDFVDANGGRDFVAAGNGDDVVLGGSGSDTILGGHGDDLISGDGGNDLLIGGGGADVFAFNTDDGHDLIIGFDAGADVIDLSGTGIEGFDALEHQISRGFFTTKIELEGDDAITLLGRVHLGEEDFLFA